MMRKYTICVSVPGNRCPVEDYRLAEALGAEIAVAGYVLVSGGRKAGVIHVADSVPDAIRLAGRLLK